MNHNEENNLYARWLTGNLTEEEKETLKKNGEDAVLKKITETVNEWSLPELKQDTLHKIKERTNKVSQAKVIPLYRKTSFLAIAASVALIIIASWLFIPGKVQLTELTCSAGQTKQYTLPDNTDIILSGNSKISYDKENFIDDRELNLEGEAYFDVKQKGNFQVNFNGGTVKVLGTKFNILSDKNLSSVKCYEGKVEVDLKNGISTLTKGNGVRKISSGNPENYNFAEEAFENPQNDASFVNVPLAEICSSLSLYYNITVTPNDVDLNRSFTGRYKRTNLDTALMMVFDPMGIRYQQKGTTIILENK